MKTLRWILPLVLLVSLSFGQEESSSEALNLTIGNTGLSFGNAPRINGLRFNWSDDYLEEVNGINFTLWKPSVDGLSGDINGIAFGIVAPAAGRIHGIALTPGAVIAGSSMNGINIGGLALVSQGSINGFNVGGLASVAQGDVNGLTVATLATVAQGNVLGVSVGGLAVVAQGSVTGFSLGGLATVAQGSVSGIALGGLATVAQGNIGGFAYGTLATVAQGDLSGISIGGLATVAQGDATGLLIGGVAAVGEKSLTGVMTTLGQIQSNGTVSGIAIAGYKIDARTVQGFNLGLVWTETENIGYLTIGGYNRTYDTQSGLVIGLFNHAHSLAGIQIGLLNHVETNPDGLKWLPFVNFNF